MYVNLSHAWFLNYRLFGNRPYEGDDDFDDDDVSSAGDSELPPSSPPDTGAFPDNW